MSLTKLPVSFAEALDIGKQFRAGALGLLIYDYPSTLTVQVVLQLRVYVLYEKSRRVRLFLTCCWVVEVSVMAIFIGLTFANIKALPVISTSTGCYYSGIFSISALFWLPALVYEPVLCLMVLWKVREEYWLEYACFWRKRTTTLDDSNSSKLVKAFARDSLIYFVGVFIELVINTVIWSHYNRYINVVVPWSGALPSILGSRLFLRMREAILFPERYNSDFYAGTNSGIDSTVRFTGPGTSPPSPTWTPQTQTMTAGGTLEASSSKTQGISAV
ncbi:hypothetical protein GSI_03470 [Ganoderma sinense ZZ0214-1]|uniref:Uncharacterized protein n=1 Tax=Ganoderma sinense ZZ0214-1 TaxID=1077348 RepID=A0A2G8SLS0_9APHY|nr:hypothetical protein GSI_03470 [Ganoderma sinense ZZ0214-1]